MVRLVWAGPVFMKHCTYFAVKSHHFCCATSTDQTLHVQLVDHPSLSGCTAGERCSLYCAGHTCLQTTPLELHPLAGPPKLCLLHPWKCQQESNANNVTIEQTVIPVGSCHFKSATLCMSKYNATRKFLTLL